MVAERDHVGARGQELVGDLDQAPEPGVWAEPVEHRQQAVLGVLGVPEDPIVQVQPDRLPAGDGDIVRDGRSELPFGFQDADEQRIVLGRQQVGGDGEMGVQVRAGVAVGPPVTVWQNI